MVTALATRQPLSEVRKWSDEDIATAWEELGNG